MALKISTRTTRLKALENQVKDLQQALSGVFTVLENHKHSLTVISAVLDDFNKLNEIYGQQENTKTEESPKESQGPEIIG